MTQAHALMVKINYYLIKGGELTKNHKLTIIDRLLAAKSTSEQAARRFYKLAVNERSCSFVLAYNGGKNLIQFTTKC